MRMGKNFDFRRLILPAAFVCFLVLTIYLHQQQANQIREEGKQVQVKVTSIRPNSGIQSGSLDVTVSYKGETYKLHGVSSSEDFVMKNSMAYHWKISATLYGDKMYYGSAGPMSILDKLYLASLAAALVVFCLNFLQLKNELWR